MIEAIKHSSDASNREKGKTRVNSQPTPTAKPKARDILTITTIKTSSRIPVSAIIRRKILIFFPYIFKK
jgi:hypothetical protein